ncbi:MAG: isomerizing glutamine--fructose-6-phosphate transaminase, partial [Pseudomonadota bacterium]|nr:isomerizing glutamine--fructose-6-phosphate transaminase [Pseudomonadota bacterium]
MCGIVGAVSRVDVTPFLLKGLQRLEYRGYDSAGVVVINDAGGFDRSRAVGKVEMLEQALSQRNLSGSTGLAHTRWATHGAVTEPNAHPHICQNTLALVCNGIVENHDELRQVQTDHGLVFTSETDTEVVVHQIYMHLNTGQDLAEAVRNTVQELEGSFALGVVQAGEPGRMIAARQGPPLIIGLGEDEFFIASDIAALLSVTRRYIVMENGDIADIRNGTCTICDVLGNSVERLVLESCQSGSDVELGEFAHYMHKEIHEQPRAIADALEGRLAGDRVLEQAFGHQATNIFNQTQQVQIIASGTSYHAGLVAKHWFEYVGVPCEVEVGSEYRYRRHAPR